MRWPMRAVATSLALACGAASLALVAPAARAQVARPTAPSNPTDARQCRELEQAWQPVRRAAQDKHDACLKRNQAILREWSEKSTQCVIGECQDWHGSWWWGRDEVEECYKAVKEYEEQKAKDDAEEKKRLKEEEEREKKEKAERKKAEDEAARKEAEFLKLQKERVEAEEALKRDDDLSSASREADRRAAEARAAEARERERKASDDARDAAMRLSDQMREMIADRQAKREEASIALAGRKEDNKSAVAAIVEGTASVVGAVVDGLKGAVKGAAMPSEPRTSASDFDIPSDGDRLRSAADFAWSKLGGLVPFASIPFKIVTNIAATSADLSQQLTHAIDDFEHADPAALEAAFAAFPEKAYGLRPVLTAIASDMKGRVDQLVDAHVVDPIVDEARARARLAVRDRDATALVAPASGGEPSPQPTVVFYWEGTSSTSRTVAVRDANGTPLLFDRSGHLYGYDAARGQTTYSSADVERLVANSDLVVRRTAPIEWKRRAVIFNPVQELEGGSQAQSAGERVAEWVAGRYTRKGLEALRDLPDEQWKPKERPR